MTAVASLVAAMRANPANVRFADAVRVASHYFGPPRVRSSHRFFVTPWRGDLLVNLQRSGKNAKPYQVRRLLAAIERLEGERHA